MLAFEASENYLNLRPLSCLVNTDMVCGCTRAYSAGVGQVEYPDWVGEMTEEQRGVVLAPYHPGYGNGAGDRRPEPKL